MKIEGGMQYYLSPARIDLPAVAAAALVEQGVVRLPAVAATQHVGLRRCREEDDEDGGGEQEGRGGASDPGGPDAEREELW